MTNNEKKLDTLNWLIDITKKSQFGLVTTILKENGGIGGCIGSITGAHGHYDLESIYLVEDGDNETIMCHLNYPAFEVDADFNYLSIDERQQIIDLLIAETKE